MYGSLGLAPWFRLRFTVVANRFNQLLAIIMMAIIIASTTLYWPITYLGYDSTFGTWEILYVEPGGPAEQAGLRVGDQIRSIYGRPVQEVEARVDVINLIGSRERPIPLVVQRAGQTFATSIRQEEPPLSLQAIKLAMCVLALMCWTTGHLLGNVRRHDTPGSPLVATFWLCMGGLLGSFVFTLHVAFPIFLLELWLLITFLAPLAIYIHLWFPVRLVSERVSSARAGTYLLGIFLILNGILVIWIAFHPATLLADALFLATPWAVVSSLAATGLLLVRSYQRAQNQHVQRQIRLIASACISVMSLWILLLVVPQLVLGHSLVRPRVLTVAIGAVPLAYLFGVRSANLYRLDRVATRIVLHLLTAAVVGTLLAMIATFVDYTGTSAVLWISLASVVLYRPVQYCWMRLLPSIFRPYNHRALEHAIRKLPTMLVRSTLVQIVVDGVRAQFGQPSLAFFLSDIHGQNSLTLEHAERMDLLPGQILKGVLTTQLRQAGSIAQSKDIRAHLARSKLRVDEQQLLNHPAIVLWCPISNSQGDLLGLLVLGMQSDLDPYSSQDQQGLQQLLAAASLALSNSVAYTRQVEDQAEIRKLYQALQGAQDAAAKALARQLHDQIINGNVRLNVESLKKILRRFNDDELRNLLAPILCREQQLAYDLRRISEELHPIGIDDPLGLPMVLTMELERQNLTWEGNCLLEVSGSPVPLNPRTQHEAFRITREAINNAIKHADATTIYVQLLYPVQDSQPVQLIIRDNGRNAKTVAVRDGHRGVRYMEESARTAGGTLIIEIEPGEATTVRFTFPAKAMFVK